MALIAFCALLLQVSSLWGQEEAQTYVVEPGDTLGAIAEKFNVSLQQLTTLNNLADPNLIAVGQRLRIPDAHDTLDLSAIPVTLVRAQPGEDLDMVATRLGQNLQLVAALNNVDGSQRLFPQQSLKIPLESAPQTPLRFGSIQDVQVPTELAQGETGRLQVHATRTLSVTATWNGLPLTFSSWLSGSEDTDSGRNAQTVTYFALLPVPALLAPQAYVVEIAYVARNGTQLKRQWNLWVAEGRYESQNIVLSEETSDLLDPELVTAEFNKLAAVWEQRQSPLVWLDQFIRPIGNEYQTTSPYGTRRSYNGGPVSSFHTGQDFGAPAGVPVVAPAPGTVALAEPLQVRGNAILLDHGGGIFTGYWHLSELQVAPGQNVRKGDVLGLVGSTGLSTGAHLHWELRIYGIAVNPMQFIEEPLLKP